VKPKLPSPFRLLNWALGYAGLLCYSPREIKFADRKNNLIPHPINANQPQPIPFDIGYELPGLIVVTAIISRPSITETMPHCHSLNYRYRCGQ